MEPRGYNIESVQRALDILELLAERGGCRVTDIARETNCSKNTAFRLLQTLMERGYVRQADDSSYELTYKLVTLGEKVASHTDLNNIVRPYLIELSQEFGETASLATLDGNEIIYLQRVLGNQPYHTSYSVGSRAKAYCSSLGKAILANSSEKALENIINGDLEPVTAYTISDRDHLIEDLQKTLERGYAIDNQENVLGIRCVGAPIFDRNGQVIGAISVSGLSVRFTDELVEVIGERLKEKTSSISEYFGYKEKKKAGHFKVHQTR